MRSLTSDSFIDEDPIAQAEAKEASRESDEALYSHGRIMDSRRGIAGIRALLVRVVRVG